MGKRAVFRSVIGVLPVFLFVMLPAGALAEEAGAPPPATASPAQPPDIPRDAAPVPEAVPAAPAAPEAPAEAVEQQPLDLPPAVLPEAPVTTSPDVAPAAPSEGAPAPSAAGPAAPSEGAPAPAASPAPASPTEAAPAAAAPPEGTPAPSPVAPAAPAEGAPAPAAEATKASEYPDGLVHSVAQGDTLWDLSAKYLGSPWRWNELWERNRFLTNPHYIYPGIRIVIFPPPPKEYAMEVKEPAPETGAAPAVPPLVPAGEEPAPAPKPEKVAEAAPAAPARTLAITPAEYVRAGEFFAKRPRGIGRIVGGTEVRAIFAEGEKVVLSLKKEVPAGQLLGVYRVRGPVRGPAGRRASGYVKYLVGLVQSQGKENGATVGVIRKSFEEITRSDIVTEEIPAYTPVAIDPGQEGLNASVITGRRENEEFGTGDFVFLDRGTDDGVARGNTFRLFRKAADSNYRVEVAKVVAIRVLPRFTTAYIVNSTQSFAAGVTASRGEAPAR